MLPYGINEASLEPGPGSRPEGMLTWVVALLTLYRQAAVDAHAAGAGTEARQGVLEELERLHRRIAAHERLETLWRIEFGGTEAGVRQALAPLVAAAGVCCPGSPMRALAEFAAEEMAFFWEGGGSGSDSHADPLRGPG